MRVRPRLAASMATALLVAGCGSADGLSEAAAEDAVGEVIDAFTDAADGAGLTEVEDDDDEDETAPDPEDVDECEGIAEELAELAPDGLNPDRESEPVAEEVAGYEFADLGQPVIGPDASIEFDGGVTELRVEVAYHENDADDMLAALIEDRDAFAECMRAVFSAADADELGTGAQFDIDMTADEGRAGTHDLLLDYDGELTSTENGVRVTFDLTGQIRIVTIGKALMTISHSALGDMGNPEVAEVLDATIDEFEAQFES